MGEWYCEKCHRVFLCRDPDCCGNCVPFDVAEHGKNLVGGSNAWRTVWARWENHPVVRDVAKEWAYDGNFSAAGILNDAFERMVATFEQEADE